MDLHTIYTADRVEQPQVYVLCSISRGTGKEQKGLILPLEHKHLGGAVQRAAWKKIINQGSNKLASAEVNPALRSPQHIFPSRHHI